MNIQSKAERLIDLRAKIKTIEEQYDAMLTPLKAERDTLDQDMIHDLHEIGFKSVKTDKATISIGERKTLQIIDENKVIEDLKAKGLNDLFKTQLVKPLWKGYSEKLAKEGKEVAGTSINTTSYISVRSAIKKIN